MSVRRFVVVCAVLLMTSQAYAASFFVSTDRDLVRGADVIVLATPLSSYAQSHDVYGVETVTVLSIQEVFKGRLAGGNVSVHEPGGRLANKVREFAIVPKFEDGKQVVLFLKRLRNGNWVAYNGILGKFDFESDFVGQKLLVRAESEISGYDPHGKPYTEKRRSAAKFLEFLRAEGRGSVATSDYFVPYHPIVFSESRSLPQGSNAITPGSYTSDQEGAGAHRGSRWATFPAGVTFHRGAGNITGGDTSITDAIALWNTDGLSNVTLVYGGSNAASAGVLGAADGVNSIIYETDFSGLGFGPFTCSAGGYGGLIGLGGPNNLPGTTSTVGGDQFLNITEGDVGINVGIGGCRTSGFYPAAELRNGIAHEVGHAIGFRHSDKSRDNSVNCTPGGNPDYDCVNSATIGISAIMRSSLANGLPGLQPWDQNAVRFMYPGSARRMNDFNGDGRSDLVWRNSSTGASTIWMMNGTTIGPGSGTTALQIGTSYNVAGIGDFNGDRKADLVWRNSGTGDTLLWLMDGISILGGSGSILTVPSPWEVAGVGDFNADGRSDLLWRNGGTGENSMWLMNGTTILGGSGTLLTIADTNWNVGGIGDFNFDGRSDILWRNPTTGTNTVWMMNGTTIGAGSGTIPLTILLPWFVAGVADLNGDLFADIVWRNNVTGQNVLWLMNGTNLLGGSGEILQIADTNWNVKTTGDFNGDGREDLAWRTDVGGTSTIWHMNGGAIGAGSGTLLSVAAPFTIVSTK